MIPDMKHDNLTTSTHVYVSASQFNQDDIYATYQC